LSHPKKVALFFIYGNISKPILEIPMKMDKYAKMMGDVMGKSKEDKPKKAKPAGMKELPRRGMRTATNMMKKTKK
jgi:hypothetical protein